MSERQRRDQADPGAERALRRLLQAAVAPEEAELSQPFASRVSARAMASGGAPPVLALAAVAWRALPALAALVLMVVAWGTWETERLQREQEASLTQAIEGQSGGAGAVLVALVLGGEPAADAGGSQ